jgi:hypothetical protein
MLTACRPRSGAAWIGVGQDLGRGGRRRHLPHTLALQGQQHHGAISPHRLGTIRVADDLNKILNGSNVNEPNAPPVVDARIVIASNLGAV